MLVSLSDQHLARLQKSRTSREIIKQLRLISGYSPGRPSILKRYYEMLLFFCAFPKNKNLHACAVSELKRVASIEKNKDLICSFSHPVTLWLAENFPGKVYLQSSEASKDTTRDILQLLLPPVEYQRTTQEELSLRGRIKKITGFKKPADQLLWILRLFEDSQLSGQVKDELFQQLKIFTRWTRDDDGFRRGFLRRPSSEIFFQNKLTRNASIEKIVRLKLPKPTLLSAAAKTDVSGIMKASLAAQYRETDPVTYGDENELELFDLGRGLQVAIAGMKKERRLSLESYIGFMAFKNGIPVCYGGGWIWGQRCKIGINIHPPFRRGESAWLFCQVLRIYYQHFGVRKFIVKPFQFGKGNPEGLKSGAFWFYYKLGFRPVDVLIRKEAASEWKKKQNGKTRYRTSLNVLRRFTSCNLEWTPLKKSIPGFDAGEISISISNMINRNYSGSRQKAKKSLLRRMNTILPMLNVKSKFWYQVQILENWALLTGLIDKLPLWNKNARQNLARLIRLKQSGKERDYILLLQKQHLLWKELQNAVR